MSPNIRPVLAVTYVNCWLNPESQLRSTVSEVESVDLLMIRTPVTSNSARASRSRGQSGLGIAARRLVSRFAVDQRRFEN
jgi:hypothetical protein